MVVIIVSPGREIAVYWKDLSHISNYKRVVLRDILHPDHFGMDILDEEETPDQNMMFF
jgi:hypothetical protein